MVPIPEGLKSRDIVCDITKSRLRVGVRGQPLLVDVSWRNRSPSAVSTGCYVSRCLLCCDLVGIPWYRVTVPGIYIYIYIYRVCTPPLDRLTCAVTWSADFPLLGLIFADSSSLERVRSGFSATWRWEICVR